MGQKQFFKQITDFYWYNQIKVIQNIYNFNKLSCQYAVPFTIFLPINITGH